VVARFIKSSSLPQNRTVGSRDVRVRDASFREGALNDVPPPGLRRDHGL